MRGAIIAFALGSVVIATAAAGCGLLDAAAIVSPPFAFDTECSVGADCSCQGDGCECDSDDLVCRCLAPECVVNSEPTGASCEGEGCNCSGLFCTSDDDAAVVRSANDDTCVGVSCACDENECVCPDSGCLCEDVDDVVSPCEQAPID